MGTRCVDVKGGCGSPTASGRDQGERCHPRPSGRINAVLFLVPIRVTCQMFPWHRHQACHVLTVPGPWGGRLLREGQPLRFALGEIGPTSDTCGCPPACSCLGGQCGELTLGSGLTPLGLSFPLSK